ncbi:unnamed protein product [Spirodela intermedia]|uniref:Uncharacterized protein n=2 Tax=Spirodela intermedia TaxID=51605 RepID=A0A7I8I926_SPIIN|nr:unnamed protein product [Spirodela intermedia]CAA6653572.1 unnamed protein product [Spirodela intermedia]CAA7387857.1 unnamed protein product [Spirodela intermedia]
MKESALLTSSVTAGDGGAPDSILFRKGQYKVWALSAIVLLALWSMFTGTVNLKWSAGNLNQIADNQVVPSRDDLDILELEERTKVVRHMWDVYAHSRQMQLPRFWLEVFEAAYEDMVNEDQGVRDAAVSEIAKMSMSMVDVVLSPPPRHSKVNYDSYPVSPPSLCVLPWILLNVCRKSALSARYADSSLSLKSTIRGFLGFQISVLE